MPRKKKSQSPVVLPYGEGLYQAGQKEYDALLKASENMSPDQISTLMGEISLTKGLPANGTSNLKSTFIDPYNLMDYLGSRAKPSRVTWQILRRMALASKPIAAIIQTRQNQISAFTQIPRRTGDIGFRITTRDPFKRPTENERERMLELTNWFINMGYEQYDEHFYDGERKRDTFDSFIRKAVRDTLTLDAVCFEVQRNERGIPHAIWPVDPGSIKYAAEVYEFNATTGQPVAVQRETTNGLPVRYVQELINGVRVAVFNEKELVYGVRNPRSDIDIGGYGLSELEILMETITQILFSEQYNAKFFTQNSLPQGVLNIAGKYTPEALESFKRQWIAQVTGVGNAWRIPIMAIDDSQGGVKFTSFKGNNKEMEYSRWMEYLIQSACAVYTIDPAEIGFTIKGGSGGSPMVEHSGAVKIDFSKDKGLRPLLKFFAHMFNENIVKEIYPDLFFEWVGIDAMSESDKIELTSKRLTAGVITVNEARAMEDLDEVKANWANAPASATLMQVYIADMTYQREQEAQAQQAEAAGPMEGQPGAAPPGGPVPEMGGPAGAPGLPAPGQPPSEQPETMREPNPKDMGIEMPVPTAAKKETETGEYQDAREEEKKNGAKKREKETYGVNVIKSQVSEDEIEISIE